MGETVKIGASRSPKLSGLARGLGISRREAAGLLEFLWSWVWEQAPIGNVGRWSDEDIAEAVDEPAARAGLLVAQLVANGWLDHDSTHRLIVHDYAEHLPQFMKQRLSRMGLETLENGDGTERSPDGHHSVTERLPLECVGVEGVELSCVEDMSGKPDTSALDELAGEACYELNFATGSNFNPKAKGLRDHLRARLADGYTSPEILAVTRRMIAEWKGDEKMRKYLRPATLYNRTKFESYHGLPPATSQPNPGKRPEPTPTAETCDTCPHPPADHDDNPMTGERYCRRCCCPTPGETK